MRGGSKDARKYEHWCIWEPDDKKKTRFVCMFDFVGVFFMWSSRVSIVNRIEMQRFKKKRILTHSKNRCSKRAKTYNENLQEGSQGGAGACEKKWAHFRFPQDWHRKVTLGHSAGPREVGSAPSRLSRGKIHKSYSHLGGAPVFLFLIKKKNS